MLQIVQVVFQHASSRFLLLYCLVYQEDKFYYRPSGERLFLLNENHLYRTSDMSGCLVGDSFASLSSFLALHRGIEFVVSVFVLSFIIGFRFNKL